MVYWLLSSFVSATLQVMLDNLAELAKKAHKSDEDVGKLEKLKRTLVNVQSVIHNAEDKQLSGMEWESLLQDLEKVAYQADDLIDDIAIKVLNQEGGLFPVTKDQVNNLLLSLYTQTSTPNMNNIQANLDRMSSEIDSLCLRKIAQERHQMEIDSNLQTSSLTDESHVYGREVDKQNIINMLVASDESSPVSIISIVGMIGVGKTTLAQLVYNYQATEAEAVPFHLKMWISVSKDFDVIKLTRSIIEAANKESTPPLLNLDLLQVKLMEILDEKKFLLVLDDLWIEKREEWDLLLKPLRHGLKGSKIIITTGSCIVKSMVSKVELYPLGCLSDEACWSLLKEEACGGINLDRVPGLEKIGKQISIKCKGLPWVAKKVGSLLHSKVDKMEWENVRDSRIWDSPVMKDEIVHAFRSCLPLHMRQCFAYCSMFPQDYGFEKNKIIKMWMAEGFIAPDKERKLIEDIGSSYFDQLLWKSFFHEEGGKYMIHNAIHHLTQSVCGERFLRVEDNDDSVINTNMRHLSLVCEKIETKTLEASFKCKGLRTFLLSSAYKTPIKEVHLMVFMKLRSLRVLDLSGTRIEELTQSVGNLKHLRFLDLSNTLLRWLPETMQKLCLLQTLRIRNCSKLLSLPKSTWRLRSLQHLELDEACKLTTMPSGLGKLTGLQTISDFIVGPESGQMKELKDMNNIRGSLCIKNLENMNNPEEALEAELVNKRYIERLELRWTSTEDAHTDEHVLGIMTCPHKNLKELIFHGYGGRMFPNWVGEPKFSKLQTISFNACNNCCLMPPLGQLPNLKFLKIFGMHELVNIEIFHGNSFQSLETLELHDMPKLKSWVGLNDNNTVFRELSIVNSPQLVTLPSLHYLQSLKKLKFDDCPQLQSFSDERLSESLEYLLITRCVMLEERCKQDGGQDWKKIEHIFSHIY